MRLKVRPSKLNLARRIDGRRSSGPRPNHALMPWCGATILWRRVAARTQTLFASLNPPAQTLVAPRTVCVSWCKGEVALALASVRRRPQAPPSCTLPTFIPTLNAKPVATT